MLYGVKRVYISRTYNSNRNHRSTKYCSIPVYKSYINKTKIAQNNAGIEKSASVSYTISK
ncbi:hypothetical protein AGMMS49531_06160 [Endomicrobiia bacterium]|nr:hypothetical protein AGMMS49531_06160 [Endomicrobiia bacterium]